MMVMEIIEHASLAEALLHAQAEYPPLEKNSTVNMEKYQYQYADLAYTKNVTDPYLHKHGLVVSSRNEYRDGQELCISTIKHIGSGESESSEIDVTEPNGDLKMFGGNITYARRYNYWCLTGRIGEDSSESRPLERGRGMAHERQNAPSKPSGDKKTTTDSGPAEGGKGKPSIGDVKNRLIKLESGKKVDGASQSMVNELKEKILGNLTFAHPVEKLIEYGEALSKMGSLNPGDLPEDARA